MPPWLKSYLQTTIYTSFTYIKIYVINLQNW